MSYRPRTFDPLDLEIIDRVYEAACARFEAQMPPSRPRDELRESLRKGYELRCLWKLRFRFSLRASVRKPCTWLTRHKERINGRGNGFVVLRHPGSRSTGHSNVTVTRIALRLVAD